MAGGTGLKRLVCVGCVFAMIAGGGPSLLAQGGEEPGAGKAPAPGASHSSLRLQDLWRTERELGNGGADDAVFPVTAGWDKEDGFFISDANKQNFLMRIGGLLQARYTYKGRNERSSIPGSGLDRSYFSIPRARLHMGGYLLDPNFNYRLEIGGNTQDAGGVQLLDAYALYKAGQLFFVDNPDFLAFGAGQFKPYFSRQELVYAGDLQMVERSLTNEFFNIGRNVGVWVQGDMGKFFYSMAITNGFGSANTSMNDIDQIPAFIGKVDFSILGEEHGKYVESNVRCDDNMLWVIGASGAFDQNNGTRETAASQQFKVFQFGIDTVFKYNVFSLQAEYIGRFLDYRVLNNVPGMGGDGSSNYAHGLYVQGGFFVMPGILEITGRVSTVWSAGNPGGDGVEVGPGLNWYVSQSHRIKVQTDLMYFNNSGSMPVQSDMLDQPATVPATVDSSFYPFDSPIAGLHSGERGLMWRVQLQLEF